MFTVRTHLAVTVGAPIAAAATVAAAATTTTGTCIIEKAASGSHVSVRARTASHKSILAAVFGKASPKHSGRGRVLVGGTIMSRQKMQCFVWWLVS